MRFSSIWWIGWFLAGFDPATVFSATEGRLFLKVLQGTERLTLNLRDNAVVDGDRVALVELSPMDPRMRPAQDAIAWLHIAGNDLPSFAGRGTDRSVSSLLLQSDGKVVLGGNFTTVNGTQYPGLARVDAFGMLDVTFQPGALPGDTANYGIAEIVELPDGDLLVGGNLVTEDSEGQSWVIRLNPDGTRDPSFVLDAELNSPIDAMALTPDDHILIFGNSEQFNGSNRLSVTCWAGMKFPLMFARQGSSSSSNRRIFEDGTEFNNVRSIRESAPSACRTIPRQPAFSALAGHPEQLRIRHFLRRLAEEVCINQCAFVAEGSATGSHANEAIGHFAERDGAHPNQLPPPRAPAQ